MLLVVTSDYKAGRWISKNERQEKPKVVIFGYGNILRLALAKKMECGDWKNREPSRKVDTHTREGISDA